MPHAWCRMDRCSLIPSTHVLLQDVTYSKSVATGWKAPLKYRLMTPEDHQKTRDMFRIVIDGANVPPPIPSFQVQAHEIRDVGFL